jgi:membrane protein
MAVLFTFIFMFMPNNKISLKAGIIAGVITGIMYQIVQWAYLSLQIGVSSYNAIYGSFAALPLFLIWLQLVWVVVLFGCEISFYVQNFASYRHNKKYSNLSFSLRKNIALQVCHLIVMRFAKTEKAYNAEQIANSLHLPVSVVQKTLSVLIGCDLIVELNVLDDEAVIYQPSTDINKMTVCSVINALETYGRDTVPDMKGYEKFLKFKTPEDDVLLIQI